VAQAFDWPPHGVGDGAHGSQEPSFRHSTAPASSLPESTQRSAARAFDLHLGGFATINNPHGASPLLLLAAMRQ